MFLHDESASRSAKKDRFSLESLEGAVSDIVLLSDTDYLICTFSSQVRFSSLSLGVHLEVHVFRCVVLHMN